METNLEKLLDAVLNDDTQNDALCTQTYQILSQISLTQNKVFYFKNIIAPKITTLVKKNRIRRELVYLCLLPNNDKEILQALIQDEISNTTIDMTNLHFLFDYCTVLNRHWLLDIIENPNLYEQNKFSNDINSIIDVLRLIDVSNRHEISYEEVQRSLNVLNEEQCIDFVKDYITKLKQIIDVVQLCQRYPLSGKKSSFSDIYFFALNNSLLNILVTFINLQSREAIKDILIKLDELSSKFELEQFIAFNVIFNILTCLKLCKKNNELISNGKEINAIIKETEIKLYNLSNLNLQIEVLENIFSLLFLHEKDGQLTYNFDEISQFYCTEREVRLLLMFLKTVTYEIKQRNQYTRDSSEMKRFSKLDKMIIDSVWRLEIIADYEYEEPKKTKIENQIINYMLSPPETLINLCLKQNDFNKVHQVIKIFNLEESRISEEIKYNTKLLQVRSLLNRPVREVLTTRSGIIEDFFERTPALQDTVIDQDYLTNYSLCHYESINANFMTVFDLATTQCDTFEKCEDLLNIAVTYNTVNPSTNSHYTKFCKTVLQLFTKTNVGQTAVIRNILCSPDYQISIEKYEKWEQFYSELYKTCQMFNKEINTDNTGKFNNKHSSYKTFRKLQELTSSYEGDDNDDDDEIKYLQRILNYVRSFSKILYIEGNNSTIISQGKDTSCFALLNYSRSEILEKLIYEKKIDVQDFEQLFTKLKLDLIYHVSGIFFPKIKISRVEDNREIDCTLNLAHPPSPNTISYVHKRNWLLALILSAVYSVEFHLTDINDIRFKSWTNFLALPRIEHLGSIFNNKTVAVLQHKIKLMFIKKYYDIVTKSEIITDPQEGPLLISQTSTNSFETAEELFEGNLKIINWKHMFDVIDSTPESQILESSEISKLRDIALTNLVKDCVELDHFNCIYSIRDDNIRRDCILNNLTNWTGEFCLEIIKSELSSFRGISEEHRSAFLKWHEDIKLYEGIKLLLQKHYWYEIYLLCIHNSDEVLERLLNTNEVQLLIDFIKVHKVPQEKLDVIDANYFAVLFDSNIQIEKIQELLNLLSTNHRIYICLNVLKVLKKLEYLEFITNYVINTSLDESSIFQNISMSLKIMSCFTTTEQEQLWCLIADPLSIIEMLIMNTKLDKLGQVLENIKPYLENCEFDENQLSVEKIDEILLKYAEKSLEFRVVLQSERKTKSAESSKLLQSLDSINFNSARRNFVMPAVVPKKSEWVQNSEVTECMCCQDSVFSMFNRRHHCRRCGRIICGTCSLKRMKVPTYEDVQVRVCMDCYEQCRQENTTSSSKSDVTTRSIGWDYWNLSDDINHNQLVREEFSYEYAPSVSLCLAILKFHTRNENYPKFLLNQCDGMLQILQPINSETAQEIDYLLVIKMLKSLALAAKMISAECFLQWGTSLADRILSQADLLGLLTERGCLYLIPTCSQSSGRYIDASTLRRLRDKLLELEQWNLALEVSTKAGLDNSGVFTAWGKTCLKAGCFQMAREKFHRCFEKPTYYETSFDLSDSISSIQHNAKSFTKQISNTSDNRPTKNPPLLNDIIEILESNTCVINPKVLQEVKTTNVMMSSTCSITSSGLNQSFANDPAIFILNKLKNLSSVAAGNYRNFLESSESIKPTSSVRQIEPILFNECIYYLSTYGTHFSMLEFYISYDRFHKCLEYILEHHLNADVFVDIYMLCLQKNAIDSLHENMSKIDCTLDIWKDYLKSVCRYLEKQDKLYSLYYLQQYLGDYVRAAMTCIKFYTNGASSFSELHSRIDYLNKAREHLQQEIDQQQWVEVASVRKQGNASNSFEAKAISNSSIVMNMDPKEIDRHINTMLRQIEVTKFLANCEEMGKKVVKLLSEIVPPILEDFKTKPINEIVLPTLFGTYYERVHLAVLVIVCGNDVDQGFPIALRIIQEYKINPIKVYCQAGKQLARANRHTDIAELVTSINSTKVNDNAVTDMCDEMLNLAIQTLTKTNAVISQIDPLIKLITDRSIKINAYIETKQLKSAYLLAAKYKRTNDIRRILREAEFLNQSDIKALCLSKLHKNSHT